MSEALLREFPFLGEVERYDAFLRLYSSEAREDQRALRALVTSPDPVVPLILLQYLEELPERKAVRAILQLVAEGNEIVSRAAMAAYRKNHYPGKARALKQLILHPAPRACRFAVRTLSRAGFIDALPLILRELPEREGEVRREMLEALRFLPDRRSVPALSPLAEDPDEPTRLLAVQVLAELQARQRALPVAFFLRKAQDESERVRRAAVEALQRYPSRSVARLLLARALDEGEPESARDRAIRALSAFPAAETVEPLTRLVALSESPVLRLAAEISLKALPPRALRRGLLPLIASADPGLRRQAALLLAEHLGREPRVRRALVALWRRADGPEQLDLADMLRLLGGAEAAELLFAAMKGAPLLAYAAGSALARMRGGAAGPAVAAMLQDPATPQTAKQALLAHWAKRGPDEEVRERVRPWLVEALASEVINIRYLALQVLAYYPLSEVVTPLLDLLARETAPDVVRTAYRQLARGLGRDPAPLAAALQRHPERERLLGHAVKVFTAQGWDLDSSEPLLAALREAPLSLLETRPEGYLTVAVHLMERGGVTLEAVWARLDEAPGRRVFLALLAAAMRNPRRRYPPLPLAFLADRLAGAEPEARRLVLELLALDGRAEALEALTEAVLDEEDPATRRAGAALLRAAVLAPA